jgi:hypothetical protein
MFTLVICLPLITTSLLSVYTLEQVRGDGAKHILWHLSATLLWWIVYCGCSLVGCYRGLDLDDDDG